MSQEPTSSQIIPLKLTHGTIRGRADGYINVLDLERFIPENQEWEKSWVRFFAQAYGTLASLAHRNKIPVDEMIQIEDTLEGEHFIWVQYDLALDYAAHIDPNLRADILITYRRARMGDISLAEEITDRSPEGELQRWLRARHELRRHTRIRNLAIQQHDGKGWIYSYCSDELNKATTGHTRKEIRTIAHIRDTRDALDTSHLALQLFGENEQIKAMDRDNAQGNVAIQQSVDPVHDDIKDIALRYNLHDRSLIYNRIPLLQNNDWQIPAPPSPKRDSSQYACRDFYGETPFNPARPSEASEMI